MVKLFVALLAVIAAVVSVLQIKRKNAWPFIVAYWIVLYAKNLWELWGLL